MSSIFSPNPTPCNGTQCFVERQFFRSDYGWLFEFKSRNWKEQKSNVFHLIGCYAIGKTSLINWAIAEINRSKPKVCLVYISGYETLIDQPAHSAESKELDIKFWTVFAERMGIASNPNPYRQVTEHLRKLKNEEKWLVLLVEAEPSNYDRVEWAKILGTLSDYLVLIFIESYTDINVKLPDRASSQNNPPRKIASKREIERNSKPVMALYERKEIFIWGLSQDEVSELVLGKAEEDKKRRAYLQGNMCDKVMDEVRSWAGFHPYALQLICYKHDMQLTFCEIELHSQTFKDKIISTLPGNCWLYFHTMPEGEVKEDAIQSLEKRGLIYRDDQDNPHLIKLLQTGGNRNMDPLTAILAAWTLWVWPALQPGVTNASSIIGTKVGNVISQAIDIVAGPLLQQPQTIPDDPAALEQKIYQTAQIVIPQRASSINEQVIINETITQLGTLLGDFRQFDLNDLANVHNQIGMLAAKGPAFAGGVPIGGQATVAGQIVNWAAGEKKLGELIRVMQQIKPMLFKQ